MPGRHWNEEEERKLAEMVVVGCSLNRMAEVLGRPVLGIRRKIKRLGLDGGGKGGGGLQTTRYHDYDTFISREAVDHLKAYLEMRRNGGPPNKIPPENIHDDSPLIWNEHSKVVKPLSPSQVYNMLHRLMAQAGLLGSKVGRRYTMKPHSLRKFFRTQMTQSRLLKPQLKRTP